MNFNLKPQGSTTQHSSNAPQIDWNAINKQVASLVNGAYYDKNTCIFDGTNDHILAQHHTSHNIFDRFTIVMQIKRNGSQSQKYLISKIISAGGDNNWSIVYGYVANKISFYANPNTGTCAYTSTHIDLTDDLWHSIAYTYNGTTLYGYMDGVLKVTYVTTFTLRTAGTQGLYIGGFSTSDPTNHWWNGNISSTLVYNRPLTQDEIQRIYIATKR